MSYLIRLIFGVWTAYVASKKGRRPVLWFIIGLFLPVIGLIIVWVLPSQLSIQPGQGRQPVGGGSPDGWNNLNPEPGADPQSGQWQNPQSSQSGYNPEWTRPSWASPQPDQGSEQSRQDQNVQVCPQCGATVDGNARYCENCGHKLRFKFNLDKSSDDALESARHCPSCNRLVRKNVGWCPHCGYKLKSGD